MVGLEVGERQMPQVEVNCTSVHGIYGLGAGMVGGQKAVCPSSVEYLSPK